MTQEDIEHVDAEEAEDAPREQAHCRHCGQPVDGVDVAADWQCPFCERYQDAMPCPTCGQTTRISLMSADLVPEPHAPARRRKARE